MIMIDNVNVNYLHYHTPGKVPCTYALTLYGIMSMVYLGHIYSYLTHFFRVSGISRSISMGYTRVSRNA